MSDEAHSERSRVALRLSGVARRLHGVDVLRDVNLVLAQGRFGALLGSSGTGKTTLLRCVVGLDTVDAGTIEIGGVRIDALRHLARKRAAVVFQRFNLIQRLSALDNVLAGRLGHVGSWRGITRSFGRADRLIALECLERVDLLRHAEQRVGMLSGGQQQRVAIARALAQQPDLIVADEPVSSLDPNTGAEVLALLRRCCREQGMTVLCSLHQTRLAREFADRVFGLSGGRITLDTPADTFSEPDAKRLYMRDATANHTRETA
jgi:phosphonate transport system ATP-binding protein